MPAEPAADRSGRRKRSPHRKQQILNVAATMFHRAGYHGVGMTGIAEAVGITPAALYRHFAGKNEILAACVDAGLHEVEAAIGDAGGCGLDRVLRGLSHLPSGSPYLGLLWTRDVQYLPEPQRNEPRRRIKAVAALVGSELSADRPRLPAADVDLLSWAVLSVFASVSFYKVDLPAERLPPLLVRIGHAVAACEPPERAGPGPAPAGPGIPRTSRRERLLDTAARLFARDGYHTVSVDDIGAAVGISGSLVYHYFKDKADILLGVQMRGAEVLALRMSEAFAAASTHGDAAARLLESYVDYAVRHADAMDSLITAVPHLPDAQRHLVRVRQHDFLTEWIELLTAARPGLSTAEARTALHCALTIVHNTVRTPRLASSPGLSAALVRLATAALDGAGGARPSP